MSLRARDIIASMRGRGFRVATRPGELNIVGLRADSTTPNRFDDTILVAYTDHAGRWTLKAWPATTDPGTHWLRQPMSPQGTAILKGNMQYPGVYAIGLHKGQYEALVQRNGPVTVIRDYDRDAVLDLDNGREATGHFGINIHRASRTGTSTTVDRHSAGCQVFADAGDFAEFMALCRAHRDRYGNAFTYTLFDIRALRRGKRGVAGAAVAAALLVLAGIAAAVEGGGA
jgi:hypothetical protein